jgi:alkylation response protein AidB-like acyl-CoA dehydrogenase
MRYADSDAQRLLRENARAFLADRYSFERLYVIESGAEAVTAADVQELAALGWMGLAVPQQLGGGGVSLIEAGAVLDELGYAAVPAPVGQAIVAARLLSSAGSEGEDHLRALASGQGVYTVSESSRARAQGGAVTAAAGELRGTLRQVPFADIAGYVLAPVEQDGERAFAALPLEGARIERRPLIDRRHFFDVTFEGQSAAGALVLGRGDEARPIYELCDALSTAVQLLEVAGAMQRTLEMSAAYISERTQFGQPVAKFQAARHRAAELLMQTESLRWAAYHAAWALDVRPEDATEVWLTKHWAIRAADRAYQIAHLLHGGIGVGMDYPIHLFTLFLAGAAVRGGTMSEMTQRLVEGMRIPVRAG